MCHTSCQEKVVHFMYRTVKRWFWRVLLLFYKLRKAVTGLSANAFVMVGILCIPLTMYNKNHVFSIPKEVMLYLPMLLNTPYVLYLITLYTLISHNLCLKRAEGMSRIQDGYIWYYDFFCKENMIYPLSNKKKEEEKWYYPLFYKQITTFWVFW